MTWIQTLDDKQFSPFKPDRSLINIHVIARVLSRLPRFGGHTKPDYSVAQHSLAVSNLVKEKHLKLPALLHDAHEAYSGFGDVPSPIKQKFPGIGIIEHQIDDEIAAHFEFDVKLFYHDSVVLADMVMFATEVRDVMGPVTPCLACPPEVEPETNIVLPFTSPQAAYLAFMAEFITLTELLVDNY